MIFHLGTFKCAHSGHKRLTQSQDLKSLESLIVSPAALHTMHCITSTLCKNNNRGEASRKMADCLQEHFFIINIEKNDTDRSKPVASHFNLSKQSSPNLQCLPTPKTLNYKNLDQKWNFQLSTLKSIRNHWQLIYSYFLATMFLPSTNVAPVSKQHTQPTSSLYSFNFVLYLQL